MTYSQDILPGGGGQGGDVGEMLTVILCQNPAQAGFNGSSTTAEAL